ncbi:MAG TPA: TonB-dependent receptor, partial [Bacteroidales bacterium]|nr:TonB-dependent receptor [Bacteroidales bacterium]
IIDSQTETPLPGANIVLKNSKPILGASSDAKGTFTLEKIPIGRQTFEISLIGYLPYLVENISIASHKETNLEIRLIESVISLNEVVIDGTGRKDETKNPIAMVSARKFTVEETERYSGSIGDPARMAANFAGITTLADQRNDIVIRGNSPLGVLWRIDGIEIPNPSHFSSFGASGGPISMINSNLLANSDFFTGAFPAEYSNALSGVFDLQLRSGNNKSYEFVSQVGMNGFELGAEGPINKSNASFLVNYRYSTLAVVSAMGFHVGIDEIPYFQDASFKISSGATKLGRFSLIGIGGYSYVHDFDSEKEISELKSETGENHT